MGEFLRKKLLYSQFTRALKHLKSLAAVLFLKAEKGKSGVGRKISLIPLDRSIKHSAAWQQNQHLALSGPSHDPPTKPQNSNQPTEHEVCRFVITRQI